jgi:uncharacterized protein
VGVLVPPHAHVPGLNARHPEDWFDHIKASVTDETPIELLSQTEAWQVGLSYFHDGYFWECHEVLEAVWMRAPDPSPERALIQAMIQLANARLKIRMGKPNAARRLCAMVDDLLQQCGAAETILGLRLSEITAWVHETGDQIEVRYDA